MSPGSFDHRRSEQLRGGSPRERLEQAKLARKEQLDRHVHKTAIRAAQAEIDCANTSQSIRDVTQYHKALAAIPFWQSGEAAKLTISDSYSRLVDISLACMNNQAREAVLCWPDFNPSPSAVAAFLALADNCAVPSLKHENYDSLAPPKGVRSLVYPYARTAHEH
jgi:hypothetical protein